MPSAMMPVLCSIACAGMGLVMDFTGVGLGASAAAASGTAAGIAAGLGLSTLAVSGEGLQALYARLLRDGRVEQAVMFGACLHASARDARALEAAVAGALAPGQRAEPVQTGLEDCFIYLMQRSRDNFGARP